MPGRPVDPRLFGAASGFNHQRDINAYRIITARNNAHTNRNRAITHGVVGGVSVGTALLAKYLGGTSNRVRGTKRTAEQAGMQRHPLDGPDQARQRAEQDSSESSQSNLLSSTKKGSMSGGEVPVEPIPRSISKVIPNHFTISLPHELVYTFPDPSIFKEANTVIPLRFRMNSIYDPVVGAVSNAQPQGRDLWSGLFKYYRVIGSEITVTLHSALAGWNGYNVTPTAGIARQGVFLWGYELLDQDSTTCTTRGSFMTAKHVKRQLLYPGANQGTTTTLVEKQSSSTLSFKYDPSEWNYHVQETNSEERWTPIGSNPVVDHDVALRIFHMTSVDPPVNPEAMWVMVYINYIVQFMEENETNYKVRDTSVATYPDGRGNADD